jgi:hypothetical protein
MRDRREIMTSRSLRRTIFAGVLAAVATGVFSAPASAYVACSHHSDCWHTDTRIHFPGFSLTFHPDNWWDRHRRNHHYRWHEVDRDHDWRHGYWIAGRWHGI